MKKITIEQALKQYDSHKGYRRTLIKEEPHIKELRAFYEELHEDDLSPASLLKLAQILIGKNTRTDTTESGKTFEELVKQLGGYEALDTLKATKQLTEDNVAFLEKHPKEAKALAPVLASVPNGAKGQIFAIVEKLADPDELINVFNELEIISQTEHADFFLNALSLLNKHDLNSDELIPLLKETKNIITLSQMLETLAAKNRALITLSNLTQLLKLKHPYSFHDLLKNVPPEQRFLDSLFQADDKLDQGFWYKDILKNFKNSNWDLHPYLDKLLSGALNDWSLKTATTKLAELKLKSECVPLVLSAIFAHSDDSIELVEAVEILNKEGLDDAFFKIAFAVPEYPKKIAEALVALKKAECFNEVTKTYICVSPKYAFDLAQFWIEFAKAGCANIALRATMLKHPACASFTAAVIEFLRKHNLHDEKNIVAICNAKLTSSALFNLLNLMYEAKILDQTSFNLLLPRLAYIKTLFSAAKCLANAEKFDSFNFDTLISDPINAVALAENLGGKSYPKDYTVLKNQGAQDFVMIRRNTKIYCQGHRQGLRLFFPDMSAEQIQSFEKDSRKTLAQAQKETLLKIAQYAGNQALEEETASRIAQDTYSSFLKI